MIKLLPILLQSLTLPQAVEQVAYTTGLCAPYLTTEARQKAMLQIQGNAKLITLYRKGVTDYKTRRPTKAQCDGWINNITIELNKHFPTP